MIKNSSQPAFLFDIDKTLLDSHRIFRPQLKELILKLYQQGYVIGMNSGRMFATVSDYVLSDFPKDMFHVLCGGGQVISSGGEVKWQQNLDDKVTEQIINFSKEQQLTIAIGDNDFFYTSENLYRLYLEKRETDEFFRHIKLKNYMDRDKYHTAIITISSITPLVDEFVMSLDKVTAKKMRNYEGNWYYDITAQGVTKALGAKMWAKFSQVDLQHTIAIGDSENDQEAFETCGKGIAMGNAVDSLKAIADEVIGDVDDDGLYHYLQQFVVE